MAKQFTVTDFFKRFPDDDSCLEHLMKIRYGFELSCPKCGKHGKFSRIRKQPAYQCAWCGHHIHPMAGTPFEASRTPLQKWFYAMYLFTTSRHGVPAKELQRQLGVTYKTAWRMGHEIRKYMADTDGDEGLGGHVEIDETYIGGRHHRTPEGPQPEERKTAVLGMVERDGKIITKVIPNSKGANILPLVGSYVAPGSRVSTDEYNVYKNLRKMGYRHESVQHNREEWVRGDTHTQTLDNFWARLKLSIKGTHVHVSKKHMAKYLGEFEYRFNMRDNPEAMFARLLLSF